MLPDEQPGDQQPVAAAHGTEIVDVAECAARLGDDLPVEELGEAQSGSRDSLDEAGGLVVTAAEAQLLRSVLQLHDGADLVDLAPRHVCRLARESRRKPA